MIALSWNSDAHPTSIEANGHIRALMAKYRELPRHIGRKHLNAAMRRVLKPGIPILRQHTPPLGTRRGRRKAGEKARSTGALRRSVATKAGQTGRNGDFDSFVWGVLGYRYSGQDRKALWLQYGTATGCPAFDMIGRAMAEFGPVAADSLAREMATGLEKAASELAGGMNPGYKG